MPHSPPTQSLPHFWIRTTPLRPPRENRSPVSSHPLGFHRTTIPTVFSPFDLFAKTSVNIANSGKMTQIYDTTPPSKQVVLADCSDGMNWIKLFEKADFLDELPKSDESCEIAAFFVPVKVVVGSNTWWCLRVCGASRKYEAILYRRGRKACAHLVGRAWR